MHSRITEGTPKATYTQVKNIYSWKDLNTLDFFYRPLPDHTVILCSHCNVAGQQAA